MARTPPPSPPRSVASAWPGGTGIRSTAGTRATNQALHANVPATTAKTRPGPPSASKSAPTDGPTKEPVLSSVLDETFAAVNSSGVRASTGSNDDSAGRYTVPSMVVAVASTYTASAGPSTVTTTADADTVATRIRSDASITRSWR